MTPDQLKVVLALSGLSTLVQALIINNDQYQRDQIKDLEIKLYEARDAADRHRTANLAAADVLFSMEQSASLNSLIIRLQEGSDE